MTKAVARQTEDRSKAFFNGLSRRLDLLGKQLSPQIARIADAQERLASVEEDLRGRGLSYPLWTGRRLSGQ